MPSHLALKIAPFVLFSIFFQLCFFSQSFCSMEASHYSCSPMWLDSIKFCKTFILLSSSSSFLFDFAFLSDPFTDFPTTDHHRHFHTRSKLLGLPFEYDSHSWNRIEKGCFIARNQVLFGLRVELLQSLSRNDLFCIPQRYHLEWHYTTGFGSRQTNLIAGEF